MHQIAMAEIHLQAHGIGVFKMQSQHFTVVELHLPKSSSVDITEADIAIVEFAIGKFDTAQIQVREIAKRKSAVFEIVVGEGF